ncbi:Hypothetical protein MVR_LOCUS157 [uncultured virus]|nr:Hypothetical protein MVR_LOCUS157 [uncultured virus]
MMKRPILDRSVYSDGQNVHNIHIQKCVCESVQNLLKDPKPEFSVEMIVESGMDERAIRLLLEYCDDESIHSAHLLSFKELLSYVWARISKSEHTTELIRILAEQMCDSECKCFTGRINRLVSVLVGFYPDITIEISDTSRIGLSSSLLKGRLTSMILSSIENTQRSYLQRLAIPRLRSNLGWRQS